MLGRVINPRKAIRLSQNGYGSKLVTLGMHRPSVKISNEFRVKIWTTEKGIRNTCTYLMLPKVIANYSSSCKLNWFFYAKIVSTFVPCSYAHSAAVRYLQVHNLPAHKNITIMSQGMGIAWQCGYAMNWFGDCSTLVRRAHKAERSPSIYGKWLSASQTGTTYE